MKTIILAGGKGSRLRPLTDTIPKALVPIGNKTLIELIMESLPQQISEVIIVTKYLGHLIEQKIGSNFLGKKILYATQPHDQDGTWAALYTSKKHMDNNEKFLVLNCDDIFKKEEIEHIILTDTIGMGVTNTVMPAKYHGIITSTQNTIEGFKRHSDVDREELITDLFANGLYLLDSNVFSFEPVALTDNEFGLPQTLLAQKELYPLYAHEIKYWKPCNTLEDLKKIV